MKGEGDYVALADGVVYRGLETPHLFDVANDELYELDEDGLTFLDELELGKGADEFTSREVLEFAESEGLVYRSAIPVAKAIRRGVSPAPSLRYLELILTYRCNLACRHCYQGGASQQDLDPDLLTRVILDFDAMQGLRLLLSGGEPLLYPHWGQAMDLVRDRGFRSVLLTNGTLLDRKAVDGLAVQEIQVSIDGMASGHDSLRGPGVFARAVKGARLARDAGFDLSVATMVHPGMLAELDELEGLVQELGAREWSLEVPTLAGRWKEPGVYFDEAAAAMARGFGGSYHGSSAGFACGHHLASVLPGGELAKCGFYSDRPVADVTDGLGAAWALKPVMKIGEVEGCARCPAAEDCGGGCRYRAEDAGPDLVMCAARGWPMGKPKS